jgi:hypothetical protein
MSIKKKYESLLGKGK